MTYRNALRGTCDSITTEIDKSTRTKYTKTTDTYHHITKGSEEVDVVIAQDPEERPQAADYRIRHNSEVRHRTSHRDT